MTKALIIKIVPVLLLVLLSSQHVSAEIKQYQYDGRLPFVQMMLNMMAAMGIIDRVPVTGFYRPYGRNNRFSSQRNYGGWNNNGFGNTGWGNGGLGNTGLGNRGWGNTGWGQPRWGVLPEESYSLNNYPLYGSPVVPPVWPGSGWVNEPWEMSVWNQDNHNQNQQNQGQQNLSRPNGNSDVSTSAGTDEPKAGAKNDTENNQTSSNSSKKNSTVDNSAAGRIKQKACVTEFCGLQAPSLNGLWVSQEGEMLGIKNSTYLWNDGQSRHLTGNIKMQNDYLLISAEGYQQLMRFKFKLDGNYLFTMQPDGKVREFRRVSDGYGDSVAY